MLRWTGKQILKYTILFSLLSGCSEFALLSSGSSLALSNNVYAKAYSGVDLTTYLVTDKGIKTHAYEYVVKAKEITKTFVDIVEPSVELASTKHERLVITIDVFKICYLSFFLAVSIVLLSMSLVYLVIYCSRRPVKVRKRKIKKKKRK